MNFNLQCTTANKTYTYTSLKGDLKVLFIVVLSQLNQPLLSYRTLLFVNISKGNNNNNGEKKLAPAVIFFP